MPDRITVFGLGEAGSLIAADLAAAGVDVNGFDPADVATPAGVTRHGDPADAVRGVSAVLAITAARDAQTAIAQAWDKIKRGTLYADLSTAPASLKEDLADTAALRGMPFADVALMGTVPGSGIATPALASGSGAELYAAMINAHGGDVEPISNGAGDAATRKLLRSVFMKGMTGAIIEALRGAQAADDVEWLADHLRGVLDSADGDLLHRLVAGTAVHHQRRTEEMRHVATFLRQLGVGPLMTDATVANLESVASHGVPPLPDA